MKRGTSGVSFLRWSDKMIGLSLGYGWRHEHSLGIEPLLRTFGIGPSCAPSRSQKGGDWLGPPSEWPTITRVPEWARLERDPKSKRLVLMCSDWWRTKRDIRYALPHLTSTYDVSSPIITGWDPGGFAVVVDAAHERDLEELHAAMIRHDLCLGVRDMSLAGLGGDLLEEAGLKLFIPSLWPPELNDNRLSELSRRLFDMVADHMR